MSVFVGLGYEKAAIEKCWEKMQVVMKCFDIPLEEALACTIYSLTYTCSIIETMKEICGIDVAEMEKMISKMEKSETYAFGMTIKSLRELFSVVGKYINGEMKE